MSQKKTLNAILDINLDELVTQEEVVAQAAVCLLREMEQADAGEAQLKVGDLYISISFGEPQDNVYGIDPAKEAEILALRRQVGELRELIADIRSCMSGPPWEKEMVAIDAILAKHPPTPATGKAGE